MIRPTLLMVKSVEVERPAVDDAIAKIILLVEEALFEIERVANGDDVPMPIEPIGTVLNTVVVAGRLP